MADVRTTTVTEARDAISDLVNGAAFGQQRTIITRHGEGKAAIVPLNDLAILIELDRILDTVDAEQALAEAREAGTKSWAEMKAELGLE